MYYTKETLILENESYNHQHGVTDSDVTMANIYITAIEKSRSRLNRPVAGDIVMIKGKIAHIESVDNNAVSVCEFAMTPFISCKFNDSTARISTNTSGGPWKGIDIGDFLPTDDQRLKRFCFFGSCGMIANGAVHFQALVNVFKQKN